MGEAGARQSCKRKETPSLRMHQVCGVTVCAIGRGKAKETHTCLIIFLLLLHVHPETVAKIQDHNCEGLSKILLYPLRKTQLLWYNSHRINAVYGSSINKNRTHS